VTSYSALPEPMLARSGHLPTGGDYAHELAPAGVRLDARPPQLVAQGRAAMNRNASAAQVKQATITEKRTSAIHSSIPRPAAMKLKEPRDVLPAARPRHLL
jgi:hypothetical protein